MWSVRYESGETFVNSEVFSDRGSFISWTTQNGRTLDLARALSLEPVFTDTPGPLPKRYAKSFLHTRSLIAQDKRTVNIVMLPPTPALVAAVVARSSSTIFDLHTGFFYDPRWSWATKASLRLMRGRTVIVTNENLGAYCRREGLSDVVVLHDYLEDRTGVRGRQDAIRVVCPLSYANDEPVDAILRAAGDTPEIHWLLTGRPPQAVREAAPRNVFFTGFLADPDYTALLANATFVLAPTNRRDTMQRAGYEALMLGVPVITSDFEVLRDFFGEAAAYARPDAADLTRVLTRALDDIGTMESRVRSTLAERRLEQSVVLESLAARVSCPQLTGEAHESRIL